MSNLESGISNPRVRYLLTEAVRSLAPRRKKLNVATAAPPSIDSLADRVHKEVARDCDVVRTCGGGSEKALGSRSGK